MSAWFQLGSAWFLTANIPKHNTFAMVPAWFYLTSNRRVSPNTLCSLASTLKTSWVPAWFQLGSSYRLVSSMVPAWFYLVPHRGVCKNTLRLLGSCSVQAWFQLGASGFLIANATKHNMFAWFRLGSTWLRIEGCLRTRYARLHSHCKPAVSQLGSSLVSHNGLVPGWFQLCSTWFLIAGLSKTHYVCLVLVWFQLGSSLVPLGSSSRM